MACLVIFFPSKSVTSDTPIELSGGINSPAKSTFNAYDTTSLHIFIRESFPDSVLLEKHQVSAGLLPIHSI